jgi:zinc protease
MKSRLKTLLALFALSGCAHQKDTKNEMVNSTRYRNERIETLANGLEVYFVDDQSLPRLSLQLLVPVGTITEPIDKPGLNTLTASLLDQGTSQKKALEIADLFADYGTEFEVQPGADFTLLTATSLVTEFTPVLQLFTEVLTSPNFPKAEIERAKMQTLVQLKGRQDRSGTWADLLSQKYFYQNYPYGRDVLGTEESIKKISRQDILQFYKNNYVAKGARLAVTGRLTPVVEAEIKKQFSNWNSGTGKTGEAPAFNPPFEGRVVRLPSPQKAQTEIRFIQNGITRSSPDYLKLRLINEMLGGSFSSRLNQKVRDDLGLTYSIYSSFDAKKNAGAWIISTFSKNPTAQKTVDEVFGVLKKALDEGFTDEELSAAKNLVKAQLPRALETADRLAFNLIALDFYGIGVGYLINFDRNIDSYSLAQINQTLHQYIKPDQMQVLIYGN